MITKLPPLLILNQFSNQPMFNMLRSIVIETAETGVHEGWGMNGKIREASGIEMKWCDFARLRHQTR